jgi:hypothetical protein
MNDGRLGQCPDIGALDDDLAVGVHPGRI